MTLRNLLWAILSIVLLAAWLASAAPTPARGAGWEGGSPSGWLPPDSGKKDTGDQEYQPSTQPNFQPVPRRGDTLSNPSTQTPLWLQDPPQIKSNTTMDSDSTYMMEEKVGDLEYRPPSQMSMEEYMEQSEKAAMRQYFKNKSTGRDKSATEGSDRLVPKINLPPGVATLFGGDQIDIRPNGQVMLDFGIQSQRIDNPALPLRQQRNINFNFDQQISMNVVGKIGQKLKLNVNWDTKANFSFENNINIDYQGFDHDILQDIEAGNISFPSKASLIKGAQNLFGIKTKMKFGRLDVTAVAAQQRGRQDQVKIQGGAQTRTIQPIRVDQYDDNRHFFLGHFFREHYNEWLASTPRITSGVQINRVEVYITNRARNTQTLRNIVGFTDLGEAERIANENLVTPNAGSQATDNQANSLFELVSDNPGVRDVDETANTLQSFGFRRNRDFQVVRGARKLDPEKDYTVNKQLGYISLNQPLRADEVLAVSYEYTWNGQRYKVGETTEDYQNRPESQAILLKLLRPATIQTDLPTWDLMMKNIYSLNASQIKRENFQLRVIYRDDSSGVDNPSLHQGQNTKDVPLVQLLGADRLNPIQELQPDGNWDFIDGITIDAQRGKAIFPVVEPFGNHLREQFIPGQEEALINKFVFDALYDSTQADALQQADKAKFFLRGRIQSSSSDEINLPGLNIAPGSVQVWAGVTQLQEGVHYTVNYQLGRVKIIDQSILESGQEIEIDYEKADLFNFQPKTFLGARLDYHIDDNFKLGGTGMFLNERPILTRVNVGNEPTRNLLWGLDGTYETESRFLTKMVDFLPVIETKKKSTINLSGEFASLHPGNSSIIGQSGNSYIDDFEGSENAIPLDNVIARWHHCSAPINSRVDDLPNIPDETGNRSIHDNRARFAWYSIDNVFYAEQGPNQPSFPEANRDHHYMRAVPPQEIFPNRDLQVVNLNERTFDLAFYPTERGIYNYATDPDHVNPDGSLRNPEQNWGGITRAITSETDFDNANIQFIEFWMMDPFIEGPRGEIQGNDAAGRGGKLVFNLGSVSEDVMRDGRHAFENGLPTPEDEVGVSLNEWGMVTNEQFLVDAFDNEPANRTAQDVGLDGLSSEDERSYFRETFLDSVFNTSNLNTEAQQALEEDPSSDDFRHFLDDEFEDQNASILQRYKDFNRYEDNSPVSGGNQTNTRAFTIRPNNEDINEDNTVNDLSSYYEYEINLDPNQMDVGRNYIVDQVEGSGTGVTWYQFRIPLRDLNRPGARAVNIDNFKSMRFMRMFMTGFAEPQILRMVNFQFVASQWRPFLEPLEKSGLITQDEPSENLQISTVNVEENSGQTSSEGIPYHVPPGVQRDRDITSGVNRRLNEQSMSLCTEDLKDGDSKAVFKNVNFDFLAYKRLKMFIHAHDPLPNGDTEDGEVRAFVRLGTDFKQNYYEVEIPLQLTDPADGGDPNAVWPNANELDIEFEKLFDAKRKRNEQGVNLQARFRSGRSGNQIIYLKGNPDLNSVQTVMIGLRNPTDTGAVSDPSKSICIWANELRVADFIKNSGWAGTGTANIKLADFANVTATGRLTTIGFGGLEDRIGQRERANTFSYNLSSDIQLHQLIPGETGINLPMYLSYAQEIKEPQFDPLNPDVPINTSYVPTDIVSGEEKTDYEAMIIDRTTRRSINFSDISVSQSGGGKSRIWSLSNFSANFAYNDMERSNHNLFNLTQRNWKAGLGWSYSPNAKPLQPLKNVDSKAFNSDWLKLVKDFNIGYLPSNLAIRGDLDRKFIRTQRRGADPLGPPIQPNWEKTFRFNRTYNLRYSPFRSLTIDYTSNVQSVVDEPFGDIDTEAERDTIVDNILALGRIKNFNQNIRANYKVPLDKFPVTDFMSANLTYGATYNWQAAPRNLNDTEGLEFGNNAQNSNERSVNGRIDMKRLYGKSGFLKDINNPKPPPKPKNEEEADTMPRQWRGLKAAGRFLMSLKTINVNYSVSENTRIPGYLPEMDILGLDRSMGNAPGIPFVLGRQEFDLMEAAEKGWMSRSAAQTDAFTQSMSRNLNLRAQMEPFKDFRIQLNASRQNQTSFSTIFRRDTTQAGNPFVRQSPTRQGSYSISFFSFGSKIDAISNYLQHGAAQGDSLSPIGSPEFTRFKANRFQMADRLNRQVQPDSGQFLPNSQDVMIPSFIAAYSGRDIEDVDAGAFPNIPMPNWRIDYSGLSKLDFFKQWFTSISLSHSYSSSYEVSNYTSSLRYGEEFLGPDVDPTNYDNITPTLTREVNDTTNELVPVFVMNQVSIREQFSPLVGINMRTKSKVTFRVNYNRSKNNSLNMSNAQITEMKSQDITFGMGYTTNNFTIPWIKHKGRPIVLKNELSFRLDMSFRDTETVQRKLGGLTGGGFNTGGFDDPLDQDTAGGGFNLPQGAREEEGDRESSTVTQGMRTIQIKPTINYVINQRVNVQLYFDRQINIPKVSTSFPRRTTRFGFQVRFSLS